MSQTDRKLPLAQARSHADRILAELASACKRIEIAGSIRREKAEVGDIEIVAIPLPDHDLFGEPSGTQLEPRLERLVRDGFLRPVRGGDYFKQFVIPAAECKLDLFLCDHDTWGMIFTQRTGSSAFSHRLVTQRDRRTSDGQWGLLPEDLRVRNGRIMRGLRALHTPEEEDVFIMAEIDWIPPKDRS